MTYIFNTRSSTSLSVYKYDGENVKEIRKDIVEVRAFVYSDDGVTFAYCDGKKVYVRNTKEKIIIQEIERPRATKLALSPSGKILAVWEPYQVTKGQTPDYTNMALYDTASGEILKSFICKKSENWHPQWSTDEVLCARNITSELYIYRENDFSQTDQRLVIKDMNLFELTKTSETYHVAVYVPGAKGSPSFVRIYRYPNCSDPTQAVSNKSFYKADHVELMWNAPGTDLLVLTTLEQSKESYYGEQGLHFLSATRIGETSLVPLPAKGPVYKVEWQPNSGQFFVVTCGFMPARTAVFNLKCEQIFDFGTGPRNTSFFNPHGNILCLAGFGSLKGDLEVYDFTKKVKIAYICASDTTQFLWAPDGEHFITATTSPRLRVNNGFKLYHYTGRLVTHVQICGMEGGKELNEVLWQPRLPLCPAPQLHYKPWSAANTNSDGHSSGGSASAPVGKYVPPSMRNRPASNFKLREEYEKPSNERIASTNQDNLSKQALKNKKKRDAKKLKVSEQSNAGDEGLAKIKPQESQLSTTGDPEKDKKIRNINKKLQQIQKLKDDRAAGKQLEVNQIGKIDTEGKLLEELKALTL